MAYLSKKNVKWNSEPVSMLTSPASEYTQVQKTVTKRWEIWLILLRTRFGVHTFTVSRYVAFFSAIFAY